MVIAGPLRSWVLPPEAPVHRDVPEIPPDNRGDDFEALFDRTTLAYHAFDDGNRVRVIGPNPRNLERSLADATVTADGAPVRHRLIVRPRFCELRADTTGARSIRIDTDAGSATFDLSSSIHDLFRDRNVIVTLSKNNSLEWIEDWARFHVRYHGAQAALLFDNGSTDYGLDDLDTVLGGCGLETWAVAPAPFRYGPMLRDGNHAYMYLQPALLRIAHLDFLRAAAAVLSIDVDELVSPRDTSIFEAVRRSPVGVVRVTGSWHYVGDEVEGMPHHRDHVLRAVPDDPSPPKYGYAPGRRLGRLPLGIHGFEFDHRLLQRAAVKALNRLAERNDYDLWHCSALTSGWKGPRPVISHARVVDPDFVAIWEDE